MSHMLNKASLSCEEVVSPLSMPRWFDKEFLVQPHESGIPWFIQHSECMTENSSSTHTDPGSEILIWGLQKSLFFCWTVVLFCAESPTFLLRSINCFSQLYRRLVSRYGSVVQNVGVKAFPSVQREWMNVVYSLTNVFHSMLRLHTVL